MSGPTRHASTAVTQQGLGTEYIPQAWHALSVLASEQQHAFRHIFADGQAVKTPGQVQHEHESNRRDLNKSAPPPEASDDRLQSTNATEVESEVPFEEAVQAEVDDVQTRAISTDPNKEVVLRFDFLSGRDSRVWNLSVSSKQDPQSSTVTCI